MSHILITGDAEFIGSSLIDYLLDKTDYFITSVDNFDLSYSKKTKLKNIEKQLKSNNCQFMEIDITDRATLFEKLTDNYDQIIHLAANAGVRPSIIKPEKYIKTNVLGTQNILDLALHNKIKKIIYASSSSVYGNIEQLPWKEDICDLNPISPYAASKLSSEILGQTYTNLYNLQFLALRFFTVYGPRQRPDLAIHKFVNLIENNKPITLFGNGDTSRDYTYIDDIIQGIIAAMDYNLTKFEIFNLGNNYPVTLIDLVKNIETITGKKAQIIYENYQPGDLMHTLADTSKAQNLLNYYPKTSLIEGLKKFYKWYKTNPL